MNKNIDFIGKSFVEVKEYLPNKGMRTKRTIFYKKIKIGYDKRDNNKYPIYLECTIESIDLSTETIFKGDTNEIIRLGNTKETTTHKKISKYNSLSISGYSKYFAGQILDTIKDLEGAKPELKEIHSIWKDWHLNDMCPNCMHQDSFNCNCPEFEQLAELETQKCPQKYEYGSKWLVHELPEEIMERIMYLFTNYPTVL